MKNYKSHFFILAFTFSAFALVRGQISEIWDKVISKSSNSSISKDKDAVLDSGLKYGLFSHSVWPGGGGTADQNGIPSKSIQEQINTFDLDQYAKDCKSFGVQYVIFTALYARMNLLYYSQVYRKWRDNAEKNNPDKNDKDLIAELANALKTEGIDLFLYTHPNDLHNFTPADKAKFGKHEFIHLLNPSKSEINSKTLTLPTPADGKKFRGAKLVKDNTSLIFSQNTEGLITITLPKELEWDNNDTAIELEN